MTTNESIIENLQALLAAVEAQPENLFGLNSFRKDTPCGTNFCTAGLACSMPKFQAMGFHLEAVPRLGPRLASSSYDAKVGHLGVYDSLDEDEEADVADFAFGYHAWQHLFEQAGDGELDHQLGYKNIWTDDYDESANMTDKDLAVARLKMQIELVKGE